MSDLVGKGAGVNPLKTLWSSPPGLPSTCHFTHTSLVPRKRGIQPWQEKFLVYLFVMLFARIWSDFLEGSFRHLTVLLDFS